MSMKLTVVVMGVGLFFAGTRGVAAGAPRICR